MPIKSKIINIGILILFANVLLMTSFHQTIIFKLTKKEIRKNILKNADENNDKLIIFNSNEMKSLNITWIHAKEFIYQSEMFDVIKKEKTKSGEMLYCIIDTKEKELIKNYFINFFNKSNKDNYINNLLTLLQSHYINEEKIQLFVLFDNNSTYKLKSFKFRFISPSIFHPPQYS